MIRDIRRKMTTDLEHCARLQEALLKAEKLHSQKKTDAGICQRSCHKF